MAASGEPLGLGGSELAHLTHALHVLFEPRQLVERRLALRVTSRLEPSGESLHGRGGGNNVPAISKNSSKLWQS